ncbi:uncharacterized protein SCHCODRAFT_02161288 [Schizophyllum commune H4-8]|uniref:uncharacterized protein n=1 Tax=Schizophyllum commune (strain H4-8 / FGSC 9210) TaxID=578458 RepID=UPI002160A133|nr:uncharacterized protein SCHCODRAFT_02161288 [Schizophyllum commune H4-8]KAI5898282.1 hypothetical protein SCHCODRAFT_02161288 [Schizophyllum commune H4-8]
MCMVEFRTHLILQAYSTLSCVPEGVQDRNYAALQALHLWRSLTTTECHLEEDSHAASPSLCPPSAFVKLHRGAHQEINLHMFHLDIRPFPGLPPYINTWPRPSGQFFPCFLAPNPPPRSPATVTP